MPTDLKRIDEPGHVHFWTISCYRRLAFFYHDNVKQSAIDGLHYIQDKFDICLIAYVIMPEHVHVMLYPHKPSDDTPIPISLLLREFKHFVGVDAKARLRDIWRERGRLWAQPLNHWATSNESEKPIWTTRGFDRNITRQDILHQRIDYCHKNPITRGLVNTADEWKWSSYRYYEHADESVLKMNWNGEWPIIW